MAMKWTQFQRGPSTAEFMRGLGTQSSARPHSPLLAGPGASSARSAAIRRAHRFAARAGCAGNAAGASRNAA